MTGVATMTASTRGSSSRSSKRVVNRVGREPACEPVEPRLVRRRRATRGPRGARRSCGRGSGPRPRARHADADGSALTASTRSPFSAPVAPVAFRKSTTSRARSDEARVVDPRVGGHDHDAVGRPRRRRRASTELRPCSLELRARARRCRRPRRRPRAAARSA